MSLKVKPFAKSTRFSKTNEFLCDCQKCQQESLCHFNEENITFPNMLIKLYGLNSIHF